MFESSKVVDRSLKRWKRQNTIIQTNWHKLKQLNNNNNNNNDYNSNNIIYTFHKQVTNEANIKSKWDPQRKILNELII